MKHSHYTILIMTLVFFAIVSCKNEPTDKEKTIAKVETKAKNTMEQPLKLVGKSLEYNYGDYVYQLQFKTDKTLHWKCVKGDEKGKEADETYAMQRLNNHTFFVSWIEADGLGVSQVINLKDNKINCYLKIDRDIVPLSGTIKELK